MNPMLTRRSLLILPAGLAAQPQQPLCQSLVLDQRTYRVSGLPALQGRVYLHTGDIDSIRSSPGFKPFEVHVIVGLYRAPFLGSTGILSETDREKLLKTRPGIWRDKLLVTRLSGESKQFTPPGLPAFTLRIAKVIPVDRGTDQVMLDICR